jgi:hypothetical protein
LLGAKLIEAAKRKVAVDGGVTVAALQPRDVEVITTYWTLANDWVHFLFAIGKDY